MRLRPFFISEKLNFRSPSVEKLFTMGSSPHYCAGCNDKIFDQWILMALEKSWHENCLRVTSSP